jgi:hypothetical protein
MWKDAEVEVGVGNLRRKKRPPPPFRVGAQNNQPQVAYSKIFFFFQCSMFIACDVCAVRRWLVGLVKLQTAALVSILNKTKGKKPRPELPIKN